MANLGGMSEQEKTELYGQISEMAEEGTSADEIADILDISASDVRSVCADLEIKLNTFQSGSRALTKSELKYYRMCRKKNEPIKFIAKRMGISVAFLTGLEKYLKIKVECRACHKFVKNRHGLRNRYCEPCRKKSITDSVGKALAKMYKNNPEFRAKIQKKSSDYYKRKRLT